MLAALGLDWRVSLARECWFYLRTCLNWREVIAGRLNRKPFQQFKLRAGMVIAFSGAPPWQIFEEIWWHDIYVRNYPHERGAPKIVVDVGANIGVFSLLAAHRWPEAQIFAYEPAPDNFAWLDRNLRTCRARRITCYPLAVAGTPGNSRFYLKAESGWHSLYQDGAESSITVQAVTLETVLACTGARRIDFLKLDCEGAEYEILSERQALLSESVGFVAMEYHKVGGHTVQELKGTFEGSGFGVEVLPEPRWGTGMLYGTNRITS